MSTLSRPVLLPLSAAGRDNSEWEEEPLVEAFERDFPEVYEELEVLRFLTDQPGEDPAFLFVPTPGWFNDGMGGCWSEGADPATVRAGYEERVKGYYANLAAMLDASNPTRRAYYATMCEQHLEPGPGRHPALLSIALPFTTRPPDDLLTFLQERAIQFFQESRADISQPTLHLQGMRLVRQRVVTEEEDFPMVRHAHQSI